MLVGLGVGGVGLDVAGRCHRLRLPRGLRLPGVWVCPGVWACCGTAGLGTGAGGACWGGACGVRAGQAGGFWLAVAA